MVYIISVSQQKGGAGKTTLAAHLAVGLSNSNRKVGLIDADPQGSLASWHRNREEKHPEKIGGFTFAQVPGWRVTSELSKMRFSHDIIIIDNASGLDMDTRATMRNADLLVVPVQPSPVDVWATEAVIELSKKEGYNTLLVLNRVTARSRMAMIFQQHLPFLTDAIIGNRVIYSSSLDEGLTAQEAAPSSSAAREIDVLVKEVTKRMNRAKKKAEKTALAEPRGLKEREKLLV